MHTSLLAPMMTLVLWTFVMWIWLYATRIPAIRRLRVSLAADQSKEAFNAQLPPQVRWKADNYNHLLEQPVLFYAVVLALCLVGQWGDVNVLLAWIYVALRVIHSIVQATVNIILLRFWIFTISTIVLLVLAIRAALAIY
ncbi:MAPEG family protein [Emcibacter sp. SYSU 3D8]|uniref:MAPEG family protein n=1 Tax=Emcibacter sp. SYSU 3D8 TaxID=3133969 RepID=UPI0031FE7808